jgi:hypothetical protein
MSFSLDLYFSHAAFPLAAWESIAREHGLGRLEPDPSWRAADSPAGLKWAKVTQGATLWADLDRCLPGPNAPCCPADAHWQLTLDTAAGRPKALLWAQFAIAYHALVLVGGVAVHDCQYHLKSTLTGSTFTDADAWETFAAREYRLAGIGGSEPAGR